jgi:hypothetical protein
MTLDEKQTCARQFPVHLGVDAAATTLADLKCPRATAWRSSAAIGPAMGPLNPSVMLDLTACSTTLAEAGMLI